MIDLRKAFHWIGYAEAVSFVVLLAIAMPLKYAYGMTHATYWPGAIHGGLFLIYLAAAHLLASRENWPLKKLMIAYLASVLPLGTLFLENKLSALSSAPGSIHPLPNSTA